MKTVLLSDNARTFFDEMPELAQCLTEQSKKGNLQAAFTPSVVEIKFAGLTYIRYENGEIVATRPCAKDYVPEFWEVCFDEEETALFVLGKEVLLDRTGDMAQLDLLLNQCQFFDKSKAAIAPKHCR